MKASFDNPNHTHFTFGSHFKARNDTFHLGAWKGQGHSHKLAILTADTLHDGTARKCKVINSFNTNVRNVAKVSAMVQQVAVSEIYQSYIESIQKIDISESSRKSISIENESYYLRAILVNKPTISHIDHGDWIVGKTVIIPSG